MQHPHHPHDGEHPVATAGPANARPPKQEQETASDEVTEVAPGVLRTQLPISMPGLGHVNCYVIEDDRGIAVVDPGLPGDDAWNDLVDRLGRAGYAVADVHTVVVTHSHPDHFGGASRLRAESGADVVTHAAFQTLFGAAWEAESEDSASLDANSSDEFFAAVERFLGRPSPWGGSREGPPSEFFDRLRSDADSRLSWDPLRPTRPLVDGQPIMLGRREWFAVHTPGHTYDHLCLFDPEYGVLLTGDHVLPTITPHISGLTPHADPLADFFGSLERVAGLSGTTVALPAHGHPFHDVSGRAHSIADHHRERLDVIRTAAEELHGRSVNDFMKVLFRERSWGEMAESETYAHLEHLRLLGELSRTDDHGIAHYGLTE